MLCTEGRPLRAAPARSFLEKTIKRRARVCCRTLKGGGGTHVVSGEKVTEVGFLAIGHPFGLRLATLIVSIHIVVGAIQAAMNIGATTRTFISPRDVAPNLQLGSAVMTNHRSLH